MSASLVGSEMCIRDRTLCLSPPGTPSSSVQNRAPRLPMLRRSVVLSRNAVSYTHLTLPTICSV
eukprot:6267717-Alexandrium_andersonii.AAC.1